MHKICFFNRSSVHYRKNIYMLMDTELPCDFYFGDSRPGNIKPTPYNLLKHFRGEFHNFNIGPFYWQKGALKLLRSEYTDIITPADPYCLSTWLLILFSKYCRKNVYSWAHGAYGDEGFGKRLLVKWKIKHLKGMFLYGEYAKKILKDMGVPESKLYVVYNSLSYDEHLELRKKIAPSDLFQKHFNNKFPNIVFIGRLTAVKKLDQILKAVACLKEQGELYNVTFIGDGSEKQKLETITKESDLLNNVWFYGACYDEKKIAEFLYNADLCVSPGNVGLTAMHAMSFGCPVISHNNFPKQMPEFEAIEQGKTGGYFKENDIESLVEAIKDWQSYNCDRDSIREACYKVIDEKYNPHVQIVTIKKAINNN